MNARICKNIRSHVSRKSEIIKTSNVQNFGFLGKMERISKGKTIERKPGVTAQLRELSPCIDVIIPIIALFVYFSLNVRAR